MRFKVVPFGMNGSHNLESYVDDLLGHRKLVKTYGDFA